MFLCRGGLLPAALRLSQRLLSIAETAAAAIQQSQARQLSCVVGGGAAGGGASAATGPLPAFEPWPSAGSSIERAHTPPSSWYTQPSVLQLEERTVFRHSWLAVAHASRLAAPGSYAAGSLLGLQWLACRDEGGRLRAFHNVCRHHAAILAPAGSGSADCFACPYHGWTYGLDGRLLKATRLRGIEDFRAADHGLVPLQAEEWGGFVWVRQADVRSQQPGSRRQQQEQQPGSPQQQQEQQQDGSASSGSSSSVAAWLGPEGSRAALAAGVADDLVHVATREYELRCNWKVFADNYLDGGYHVSVAHPELASNLDLSSYASSIFERLSVQTCQSKAAEGERRLAGGRPPAYLFVFPNLMINRYGPWMDTNVVVPLAHDRCKVVFDWYCERQLAEDGSYVAASLEASNRVQQEDVELCESVQRGLESAGYDTGRYAPGVEGPMFHFHRLLHADLAGSS